MAEPVRVWCDAPERARVEPPPPGGKEDRVHRLACELRPRLVQVAGEPVRRLLAQRNHALLAAFASHMDLLPLEIDVRQVQIDRLPATEAGRVHELHEGAVAQTQRPG